MNKKIFTNLFDVSFMIHGIVNESSQVSENTLEKVLSTFSHLTSNLPKVTRQVRIKTNNGWEDYLPNT